MVPPQRTTSANYFAIFKDESSNNTQVVAVRPGVIYSTSDFAHLKFVNDATVAFIQKRTADGHRETISPRGRSPYYYYYYGAGSTGRKLIDLDNLERLAAKRNAAKYLQNYIEIRTINDEYRSIYQNLDTRFLDDVLSHWINHLPEDKLLEGYKIIRSYWDDDEIVNHIIRNHSKTYKKIVDFLKSQESLSKYMTISNNSNTDHIQYSKKSCKKPLELLQSKISKSLIIIRKYGLHVFLGFLRYRINM